MSVAELARDVEAFFQMDERFGVAPHPARELTRRRAILGSVRSIASARQAAERFDGHPVSEAEEPANEPVGLDEVGEL